MYALVAAVVVATPAAYASTAVTISEALVATETNNTAALHTTKPATITHRRPRRSDK
jgi:hypothetical protein